MVLLDGGVDICPRGRTHDKMRVKRRSPTGCLARRDILRTAGSPTATDCERSILEAQRGWSKTRVRAAGPRSGRVPGGPEPHARGRGTCRVAEECL